MPTPYESARLNLQLFDMRRESTLREARAWFTREFTPTSFAELVELAGGDRNAAVRMVLGYWDMAASLVTSGAIDGDAFRAAHGEIFLTFAKVHPFLAELRALSGEPAFCAHLEAVVMAAPDAVAIMERRRAAMLGAVRRQAPAEDGFVASALNASLTVRDLGASVAWYRDVLRFTVDREHERGGVLRAVSLRAGAARLLLGQDDGAKGADRAKGEGFSLQFVTAQPIDAIAARVREHGGTIDTEPTDMPTGARVFRLRDPDGFRLVISSQ